MEYRVRKIVAMRRGSSSGKRVQFRVEWWGYSAKDATWEPASRVKNLRALDEFLECVNGAVGKEVLP